MAERFTPLLTNTDWNAEWMRLQEMREHFDSPEAWNERSKSFSTKHGSHDEYVGRFLELAAIRPGETVLDMGCGTGALAIPLAALGHHVIAADFSSGMLNMLECEIENQAITTIDVRTVSWEDDWDAVGIGTNCVDVALASRSIATNDLGKALDKLTKVARRRACITLGKNPSPRVDDALLEACGLRHYVGWDFVYAFNILVSSGFVPEVDYITSTRYETFESFDDSLEKLADTARSSVRGYATDDELAMIEPHLRSWLIENLIPAANDSTRFELRHPRTTLWAFISWKTA